MKNNDIISLTVYNGVHSLALYLNGYQVCGSKIWDPEKSYNFGIPTEDLIAALSCDFNITLKEDQK